MEDDKKLIAECLTYIEGKNSRIDTNIKDIGVTVRFSHLFTSMSKATEIIIEDVCRRNSIQYFTAAKAVNVLEKNEVISKALRGYFLTFLGVRNDAVHPNRDSLPPSDIHVNVLIFIQILNSTLAIGKVQWLVVRR